VQSKITTLLMFDGQAAEAMGYYTSLFDRGQIERIERYRAGEQGAEGTVKHAVFRLGDRQLMCIDSPVKQPFTFTPAISLVAECDTEAAVDELYARLSDGGKIFVPLDEYPFNRRFGWLTDRYGVSWQLSLAHDQR
jgi:predicted 3-demethylubiquinone-9 3-methyltransferase (glyoxalase superfamily)